MSINDIVTIIVMVVVSFVLGWVLFKMRKDNLSEDFK